jgi:hypothetical protein
MPGINRQSWAEKMKFISGEIGGIPGLRSEGPAKRPKRLSGAVLSRVPKSEAPGAPSICRRTDSAPGTRGTRRSKDKSKKPICIQKQEVSAASRHSESASWRENPVLAQTLQSGAATGAEPRAGNVRLLAARAGRECAHWRRGGRRGRDVDIHVDGLTPTWHRDSQRR